MSANFVSLGNKIKKNAPFNASIAAFDSQNRFPGQKKARGAGFFIFQKRLALPNQAINSAI